MNALSVLNLCEVFALDNYSGRYIFSLFGHIELKSCQAMLFVAIATDAITHFTLSE